MKFDPYIEWLHIPAERRPPTHYDLLGLPPLESDIERIRAATLERTALVRRYQLSDKVELVNRLLAELSQAFDCLTNAARKRAYDDELRGLATVADREINHTQTDAPLPATARIEPAPALRPVLKPVVRNPEAKPAARESQAPTIVQQPSAVPRPRRRKSNSPIWGVGIASLCIAGIVWMLMQSTDPIPPAKVANTDAHKSKPASALPFDVSPPSVPTDKPAATAKLQIPPVAIAPFDAFMAKKRQQDWADHLGLPMEKVFDLTGGVKLVMVLIPPGEFLMGYTKEDQQRFLMEAAAARDPWAPGRIPCEGPQHWVRISRPFYVGKYEVAQTQILLLYLLRCRTPFLRLKIGAGG